MPEAVSRLLDLGFERVSEAPTVEALPAGLKRFEATTSCAAMGTLVSLTALGRFRALVEEAVGRAFQEMSRLVAVFSRFERASAVAVLNDAGRLAGPPRELSHLVSQALTYHRITRGAFDISVAPLVDLFRRRLRQADAVAPSGTELRDAMALVGVEGIAISRREIRFDRTGMGITLDGIAKGYIVDAMADCLDRGGIRNYLINAGGDIRAQGHNQRDEPWTIAVRDPRDDTRPADVVRLSAGAIATSGSYEIYYDAERQFHHIVDARTGRSPTHCASATVIAPTATAADTLATTVFVLAPLDAVGLVESLGGCSCFALEMDGRRFASRGWARYAQRPGHTRE